MLNANTFSDGLVGGKWDEPQDAPLKRVFKAVRKITSSKELSASQACPAIKEGDVVSAEFITGAFLTDEHDSIF